ncbi:MAG: VF530 family protein [Pseudomonadales bacterium]|nr:VF530 family protein [Pseudomonadales bacterium]
MNYSNNNDPLHGVTLKTIVTRLQQKYGWQGLADRIRINCFSHDPSIQSSLKFLRKTPWARKKVEALYIRTKWPAADTANSKESTITDVKEKTDPWSNAQSKRDKNDLS